ncbi:MAG TPA: hypothetical protein VK116_00405, partial [Planctomycetota bacterium]|nr:hypothetical protein [Planctomycetota bacterium]
MRGHTFACFAAFLLASTSAVAQDAKKLALKVKEDDTLEYVIERTTKTKRESDQGDFESTQESKATYKIEVADVNDDGTIVLRVRYGAFQGKGGFGDQTWTFDSTKKAEGESDPVQSFLREAASATYTATIAEGRIRDVTGGPEIERGGGQGRRGLMGMRSVVGARPIRQDLELIVALPAHGQTLEKGKTYVHRPEERGQGQGRGRGFFGRGPRYAWKVEEIAADKATFTLSAAPRDESNDRAPEIKVEGKATVALATGTVASLEAVTESKSQSDF